MQRRILLVMLAVTFFLFQGCSGAQRPSNDPVYNLYYEKIREWQKRIGIEGWAENQVEDVLRDCLGIVRYRMEIEDHWDTPQEFMQDGLEGDCEDIAVFMMASLKRLRYPYGIRIVVVKEIFGDHAVLKVELPKRKWKIYDTTPLSLHTLNPSRLRPIIEFDERTIGPPLDREEYLALIH